MTASFEFVVGEDPSDVYIKIDDRLVFYKRCETPEIAKIMVDGQNESRRKIMGPESTIEFTGETLYFGDHAVDVKSFEISDFESVIDATDYTDSIIKIVTEPMEFTGTIDIKFRGLVKLLGFWPAVKYKVDRLVIRIKKYLRIVSPSGRY